MSRHLEQHPYSLQIHVLEYIGQYQKFVWHWPVDIQGSITLAEVLQRLPDMDEVGLKQARACKIELTHSSATSVWWLTNFNTEMICLHNDVLLPAGQSVRLSQGDDIEFGFTHLRISLTETLSSKLQAVGVNDPQVDLVMESPHEGLDVHDKNMIDGQLESDIQEVTSLGTIESPQESAVALTQLVHAHLVATRSNTKNQIAVHQQSELGSLFVQSTSTDELSRILSAVVNEPEPLSDLIEKKNRFSETNDLIDQLHQKYIARLRRPFLVNAEQIDSWQELKVNQLRDQDDEFVHLRQRGNTGDIYELLAGKETTPRLLAHFDQLGEANILLPESFESVIHLFAPDELKSVSSTTNQSSIPHLTRLEHHSMAIDSNMDSLSVTSKLANVEKWEW